MLKGVVFFYLLLWKIKIRVFYQSLKCFQNVQIIDDSSHKSWHTKHQGSKNLLEINLKNTNTLFHWLYSYRPIPALLHCLLYIHCVLTEQWGQGILCHLNGVNGVVWLILCKNSLTASKFFHIEAACWVCVRTPKHSVLKLVTILLADDSDFFW